MNDLLNHINDKDLRLIADKIAGNTRITPEDGLLLYKKADLALLGLLAGIVRRKHNGNFAYFNHNFHIEPTNKCIYNCRFCSYHKPEGDPESWEYSHEEMLDIVKRFDNKNVTEIHIVGGVHPSYDLHYWGPLIKRIKEHRPNLHVKAFSAIELDYMITRAGCTIEEGLKLLKGYGLDSIPGGGAEIFDEELRKMICDEKSSSELWLTIHETAHRIGIPSNATMLYGHIETYNHRIDHMERLRTLQDKTGGFNAFIPLKYKKSNNSMSYLGEVNIIEDLRNYAVSRIYLDNFPHIKAYWPMTGKEIAQLSLSFGVDDMDGTIDDTTRIYSMAGSKEEKPAMTTEEICHLIREAGFIPVERDSLYNPIKEW
ncbi:MAG: aminofutalosine synthase MqnE [Bacteroidales bacterium]|nr:aminofutalosine synthase MqnE [Bacteroidales bacterium]MDP3003095.1 aminofutalosine synthase MqnE [Bacteroidales bacterium]